MMMEIDYLAEVIKRFERAKAVCEDEAIAWTLVQQSYRLERQDYYRSLPKNEPTGQCEEE